MADENVVPTTPETPAGNPNPNPAPEPAPAASWIPQELRGSGLTKFKTSDEALKAYVNLESAYGKKFEEHLKEDADPAVKSRVRAAMGVPEAASGYEDVKIPDGYQVDTGIIGSFKETAFKAGISKGQAKALQEWFIGQHLDANTSEMARRNEARETAMGELDKRWGAAKGRNIALVHQLMSENGGADLKAAMDETGAGNHPVILEWMAKLASKMGEDNLITPTAGGLTPKDALDEMRKIRGGDQKSAYWNSSHPEHKQAVERIQYLTQYTSNAL